MSNNAGKVAIFRPFLFNGVKRGCRAVDAGPFKLGVVASANSFGLVWRYGDKSYGQGVKRVWLPTKHSSWVLCPTCGKKTRRLFSVDGMLFTCQKCAGLGWGYDLWHQNGQTRQPKTPAAWVRWYVRRASKAIALKGGKSVETQARTACPTGGCPGGTPCGH